MLLSNPIASPMWPTLGWTFFGLFGASFVALFVQARGRWRELSRSVLFQRWRTWLIIAPLFSLAALGGPLATALFAAALALQSSREYAALVGLQRVDRAVLVCAAVAVPLAALAIPTFPLAMALPLVASVPVLLGQDTDRGVHRILGLAFGLWYVPLLLSLLVTLESDPRGGPGLLLAVALATALSDVGAFTFGKAFGHRQLAPRLSPSKTVAGVVGNGFGALLGVWLLRPLVPHAPWLLLATVVAVAAVWGDLLESLLKRAAGTKDAGSCLPGFGGVLDRIDSLLLVLPLTAVVLAVTA
jgi:phosphatidate cytidylyltransferase